MGNKSIEQFRALRKNSTFFQSQEVEAINIENFAKDFGKQSENLDYDARGYVFFCTPKENCQTTVTKACNYLGIKTIKELKEAGRFYEEPKEDAKLPKVQRKSAIPAFPQTTLGKRLRRMLLEQRMS